MISLLLHKSMSGNNKDALAYYPKDSTNQYFFCEQQAVTSGFDTTIYSFDFF